MIYSVIVMHSVTIQRILFCILSLALLSPVAASAQVNPPELLNGKAEVVPLNTLLGRDYTIVFLSRATPELTSRDIPNLRNLAMNLGAGVNGFFVLVGELPIVIEKASLAVNNLLPVVVGGKKGLGFLDIGAANSSLIILDKDGNQLFRQDDAAAPVDVESALALAGLTPPPIRQVQVGEIIPTFDLPGIVGKVSMGDMVKRGAAIFYIADVHWERLTEDVQRMQFLADDLFDQASVAVLVYGGEVAELQKLTEALNLTVPLAILTEVAHKSLVADEPLPLLIVVNGQGRVTQINSYASPPDMEQALSYINLEKRELKPMSVEFGERRVLISGIESKWIPRASFTSDGGYLVYDGYSADTDSEELWLAKLSQNDAGDYRVEKLKRLTYNRADDFSPWIGGSWMFFNSLRSGNMDLWSYNLQTGNFVQLTSGSSSHEFVSCPGDGSQLVFQSNVDGNWDLWLCGPFGRNIIRLTDHWAADYHPAYSSDGTKRIAFCSERAGSPDIWVVGWDGRGLTQLTFQSGREDFPNWNSDGTRLVYCSDASGNMDVWMVSDDGLSVAQVSNGAGDELCPIFSPKNDAIFYFEKTDGSYDLVYVPVKEKVEAITGVEGSSGEGQTP
jgi:hypothetical protein